MEVCNQGDSTNSFLSDGEGKTIDDLDQFIKISFLTTKIKCLGGV